MNKRAQTSQTDAFEIPAELVRRRRPFRMVTGFLLALYSIPTICFAIFVLLRLIAGDPSYDHQIDHGEGLMLELWREVHDGEPRYGSIAEKPWIVNNYPPLYTEIVSQLAKTPSQALIVGRRISALSLAVAFSMLMFIVIGIRRGGQGFVQIHDVFAGLIASVCFLVAKDVAYWGYVMRVDMLGIALTTIGMAFICLAGRRKTWPVIVAALFFILAVMTKHSLLAAPLALVLACLNHRRRRAFRFSCWFAGALVLLFAVGWFATDGQIGLHLVRANETAYSFDLAMGHIKQLWAAEGKLIARAFFGVFVSLAFFLVEYSQKGRTGRFFLAHYLWITAVGLLMTGKSGSNSNYYLEFHVACALSLGLLIADLIALPATHCGVRRMFRIPVLILAILLGPSFVFFPSPRETNSPDEWHVPYSDETKDGLLVVRKLIGESDKPILSQDMSLPVLAGKKAIYHPFMMPDLERRSLWNDGDLVRMLERHEFAAVFLSFELPETGHIKPGDSFGAMFTPATLRAIRNHYERSRVLELLPTRQKLVVYLPRK